MSLAEISTFLLASFILALTPGPDVIFVIVTSLGNGFKTAFIFILGLASGIVLHTFLIVLGISTLVSQSPYGLVILKFFAVGYLLYLAYKTYIHRKDHIQLSQPVKVENYYLRGFIMNVTNPKVLLFFLAFFPQFARLSQSGYQQRILILGALFIVVTLIVFSSIAWISAKGSQKFIENPIYHLRMNWLAIFVFVTISLLLISA